MAATTVDVNDALETASVYRGFRIRVVVEQLVAVVFILTPGAVAEVSFETPCRSGNQADTYGAGMRRAVQLIESVA